MMGDDCKPLSREEIEEEVILFSEFHEKQPALEVAHENAVKVNSWDEVLEELGRDKERKRKGVTAFPGATIQKPF
jgi:hypothetical protein